MSALNTSCHGFRLCLHFEYSTPPSQYLRLIAQIFFQALKIFLGYLWGDREIWDNVDLNSFYLICIFLADKALVYLLEWELGETSLIYGDRGEGRHVTNKQNSHLV